LKKIKYTDDNLLKNVKNLKLGESIALVENARAVIGIECIRALGREYIFIGSFDAYEENVVIPKPTGGGAASLEDFEADIIEYIDDLVDEYVEDFNKLQIEIK